jgi:ABC-type transport system involved in Fe-S cluster assembly fused permease/ATPase subunit
MYFLPGTKKISMTVTDSKGRSSSITREITVTAGPYAVVYWIAYALVGLICLWILRVIWRRVQR